MVAWRARISRGSVQPVSGGSVHRGPTGAPWPSLAAEGQGADLAGVACLIRPSSHSRHPPRRRLILLFPSAPFLLRCLRRMIRRSTRPPRKAAIEQDPDQTHIGVEEDEPDPDGPAVSRTNAISRARPTSAAAIKVPRPGSHASSSPNPRSAVHGSGHHPAPSCRPGRRTSTRATVPGSRPGRGDHGQVKSRVAWSAKPEFGSGTIPNTTVKATETPMAREVSQKKRHPSPLGHRLRRWRHRSGSGGWRSRRGSQPVCCLTSTPDAGFLRVLGDRSLPPSPSPSPTPSRATSPSSPTESRPTRPGSTWAPRPAGRRRRR